MTAPKWWCLVVAVLVFGACASHAISASVDGSVDGSVDATPDALDDPDVVTTTSGPVRGALDAEARVWLGIPYAAPPVGDRRWRAPSSPTPWTSVRDATAWPSGCVQISTSGQLIGGSEDCLYLNVWAPTSSVGPLPVLVFLHGGYFLNGSTGQLVYGERIFDGAYVATHGPAIVVTVGYRLGAFGFLAHPGAEPNAALEDQLAALGWVRDNIPAFGGDPSQVLLFGESAGGASTCLQVSSPRARGLFSRALIQSGSCVVRPPGSIEALSEAMIRALGCEGAPDPLGCAREVPADRVAVAATIDLAASLDRWGPVLDGDVLPVTPAMAILAGQHARVPLIIGTTADEYTTLMHAFQDAPLVTVDDYRSELTRRFAHRAPDVLARYPAADYPTPQDALIAVLSDAVMTCPTREIARAFRRSQMEPVRRYVFAHRYLSGPFAPLGAGHALELPFVFHNLEITGFTPTAEERALADAMVGYWVRFAATGDPNGGGAVAWPVHDASDTTLVLDSPVRVTDHVRAAHCDFWLAF